MSLDLLKERFSGKPITSQYEEQIDNKEKIIEKLEEETQNLFSQVSNLETEKNNILLELNKARHFEEGAFSIKEKDYAKELQSKDVVIKEVKQKTDLLYKELDKKDERLSYKNSIINNSLNIIKEARNKINYFNGKLKNSKNSKKELQLEIKKTYQDYIFKMDNLENDIKDRNDIINEQKQILKENNKNLKELINAIRELKIKNTKDKQQINELNIKLKESKNSLILENDTFKNKLNEKENHIIILSDKVGALTETIQEKSSLEKTLYKDIKINKNVKQKLKGKKEEITNLNEKINLLSKEIKNLSNLSYENSILETKLQKAENFENSFLKVDEYKNKLKIKDNNIEEKRQDLLESIKQINNLSTKINNLQSKNKHNNETMEDLKSTVKENKDLFTSQNNDFKNIMNKKDNYIIELKKESETLSEKVIVLSDLAKENNILEKKLQEAEQFQDVVKNNKNNYQVVPQMKSKILNTDNLIFKLKEISKQKQGLKPLNWQQWIEIPESNYLNELNHNIALKLFNENNSLFLEDERKKYDKHSTMNFAPDLRLVPLTVSGLQGYYSSQVLSNTFSDGDGVTQWDDLSVNKNHLTQGTANAQPEYNASKNSLQFKRDSSNKDHMDFTTGLTLSEFTLFFALDFDDEDRQTLLKDTAGNDLIEVFYINANRANIKVNANDGTNSVTTTITPVDGTLVQGTKLLLTCKKKAFNSDDGFGQVEWFINKTSLGTSDDYDENILQTINELGFFNNSTGFEGNMYEMAIYEKALDSAQIGKLQDYFIDRTSISV